MCYIRKILLCSSRRGNAAQVTETLSKLQIGIFFYRWLYDCVTVWLQVYYSDHETPRHLLTQAEAQEIEKKWKECDADGIEVGTFIATEIFFDARSATDLSKVVDRLSKKCGIWMHLAGPRRVDSITSNLPATQWDLRHVLWWAVGFGWWLLVLVWTCVNMCELWKWMEKRCVDRHGRHDLATSLWRWGSFYTWEGSCNWSP